jgi:soluble lytic murein transglycosylase-like protein
MPYTTYQLGEMTVAAANRYGLNPRIAVEQIRQESSFNPNATGPLTKYGTAKGLAQFIDDTWRRYGSGSPYDPAAALDAYGKYMSFLLRRYNGNYSFALAAYNAGEGNVDKYGGIPPFAQTQNYVREILARAAQPAASGSPGSSSPGSGISAGIPAGVIPSSWPGWATAAVVVVAGLFVVNLVTD